MGNSIKSKSHRIFAAVNALPSFTLDDLASLERDKNYLKVLLYRHQRSGRVIRLKKGLYVSRDYLDRAEKTGRVSVYTEFVANQLSLFSYLSLEYVLYSHHLLTDIPANFTSVSRHKTASFTNPLGRFFYHKIKTALFTGFTAEKQSGFVIFKATKAKALFDYLYFRRDRLFNRPAVNELRLNLETFSPVDKRELKKYVQLAASPKMTSIYRLLFENHD